MKTSDFAFVLPEDRIAQFPIEPRDASKLLVLNRTTGAIEHRNFREIGSLLKPGDLLVRNVSKVFQARLQGFANRKHHEVFLLRPDGPYWRALIKKSKFLHIGANIEFDDASSAILIEKCADGTALIDFGVSADAVMAITDRIGLVPTPPYVKTLNVDAERYQTVYAREPGSVAAPTAGFHFTNELIDELKSQGIKFADIVLHIGMGTFQPVKTENIEEHVMHAEWVHVPEETRALIQKTRAEAGRVIAVGTTTARALESGVTNGMTNIFITPGYQFKSTDGLITNFHLPKSTLLLLVSAFVQEKQTNEDEGRKMILKTYTEAIQREYRFYSFGDAMFIV